MSVSGGEVLKTYIQGLASRFERVERAGFADPAVTASAVINNNYFDCFWGKKFAFRTFPEKLSATLRDNGLLGERVGPSGSTRGGDLRSYLIHFVGAVSAYDNPSAFLRLAINAFGADPGIQTSKINAYYPRSIQPSFWYSIGGDVLLDSVVGSSDKDEYRADLLGLRAVKTHLAVPKPLQLSEMMYDAAENVDLVLGDSFESLEDYQIAMTINPVFGHKVIRLLAKHIGAFQRGFILPVERVYLT